MAINNRAPRATVEGQPTIPSQQHTAADSPFIRELVRSSEQRTGTRLTAAQLQDLRDSFRNYEPTPRSLASFQAHFPDFNSANVTNDAPPSYQTTINEQRGIHNMDRGPADYEQLALAQSRVISFHSAELSYLYTTIGRLIASSQEVLATQRELINSIEKLTTDNKAIIAMQGRLLDFHEGQLRRRSLSTFYSIKPSSLIITFILFIGAQCIVGYVIESLRGGLNG
ncbi:MAG: hypothetical protein M1812_002111 [Candelaria pacifica]|nr:MAG: hypothetical protein M1812_002111 [Candelaria pacifica]